MACARVVVFVAALAGTALGEPPFYTMYQQYELRHVVPAGQAWHDFARLAPSPQALRRALFAPVPSLTGFFSADDRVVHDLRGGLVVRLAASSWAELIEEAQPTLVWNEGDMLWVGADDDRRPLFVLDEAFLHAPRNGAARWVLLDATAVTTRHTDVIEGRNVRAVASLREKIPKARNDAGFVEDYAVSLGRDPRYGEVFEIGWQCEMNGGNGHIVRLRHIYVLRDVAGRWHFLGEGLGNFSGRSGMTSGSSATVAKIRWVTDPAASLPIEIRFRSESTEYDLGDPMDGPVRERGFVQYQDAVLDGPFPAKPRRVGRAYLLTSAHDTFDRVADHVAAWLPDWQLEGEKKAAIREMWRRELRRLNPALPAGGIAPGTRVDLLSYAETVKAVQLVLGPR
ncbi:MAG TPA: hypothetical protein VM029_04025 [Opitutaceae bacterium]|nr:hypothetical protein [Opitutaceae bacterium]